VVGTVQPQEPAREFRSRSDGGLDLREVDQAAAEQRVGQRLSEILYAPKVFTLAEMINADQEMFADSLQDSCRQWPLVLFDLV